MNLEWAILIIAAILVVSFLLSRNPFLAWRRAGFAIARIKVYYSDGSYDIKYLVRVVKAPIGDHIDHARFKRESQIRVIGQVPISRNLSERYHQDPDTYTWEPLAQGFTKESLLEDLAHRKPFTA